MASSATLKISNRSAKQPIKKLPTSIEITEKTTVQDVKDILSKKSGGRDPERFGLFDAVNKKLLKDRKALLKSIPDVTSGGEILVKDLGPQLSWTTVFMVEYFGPIWIHLAIPFLLRPYIYGSKPVHALSSSQYLSIAMIILHFIKREYETVFVHKFSLSTMPFFNIFRNSFHYWILSGLNLAYWIYSPTSYTQESSPTIDYINIGGLVLYVFGEVSNFITHQTLSSLRSPGGTERGIPTGYGFDWVTCPNYLFEIIAWVGVTLVTKSWSTVLFIAVAYWQMNQWAIKKEKALRTEFPGKYKKKKYVLIPLPGL